MGNSGVWLGPPPTPLCLLIFPRRSSCIVSGLVLDLSQSLYQHDCHSHLSVPPVTPRSCEVPRAESFTEDLGKASSGGARCHWTVRMIARAAHRTCPGLLELSPSPCRPSGEGRGKKGWQGANVVAESPRRCPAGSETVFHCRGRSVGTSRPEGAPCSDSQKNAVPAGSAGQNSVYPAGRPARRDPRGCLRREREPALRALSSCVLRHTTHTPCALSAFEEEETEAEKD